MDKSSFYSAIANLKEYTLQDKLDIIAEKTRFPYCSLLQMLDLLSDKAVSIYKWEERYEPKVLLHMPEPRVVSACLGDVKPTEVSTADDKRLMEQIEQLKAAYKTIQEERAHSAQEAVANVAPAAEDAAPAQPKTQGKEEKPYDIIREINDYQEVSFKTAPKSEILSKFLEVGSIKVDENSPDAEQPVEVLAKKSICDDESIETETLALIYEKQGKLERAIGIYQKLIDKNPEKNSTFAARIEELKNKINNTKTK